MGDWGLEDKLLRSNIPGRFSTWEPDSDHEARSDSCEEEVAPVDDNAAPEEPEAQCVIALMVGETPSCEQIVGKNVRDAFLMEPLPRERTLAARLAHS